MSRSDFNDDGYDDLTIGVPDEIVAGLSSAGAVNVLFGSSSGLTATGSQYWHQNRPGVAGVAGTADLFGFALASGDFDNDGFSDLAIGVPFSGAGEVNLLYGSPAGLSSEGDQLWTQNSRGVLGSATRGDKFGGALATGDFDNDGFDDLAIGNRYKPIGSANGAGAVSVLYGSTAGLASEGDQFWSQDSRGIGSGAEGGDAFGAALAVGDFDDDGFDDLAVGAPEEDVGRIDRAGAVNVIRGSATGLTAAGAQIWTQDSRSVRGHADDDDYFGDALDVGDFDNDGFDDLVVGASFEDVGALVDAGAVNVLHGSATGLTAAGDQIWTHDSRGVRGAAESGGLFGRTLAVGDFDADGFDDLAIGAPYVHVGSAAFAGAVNLLYGSASGLSAARDQLWHQNVRGVVGDGAEYSDLFGDWLTVGDFNDDGFEDLAIGVTGEAFGSSDGGGAVNLLLGSAEGLTAVGDQFWFQDAPGVLEQGGADDLFGFVLA